MEIIKGVEQGTEEWHALRLGIITMSQAQCLLVDGKSKSGLGAGAMTYMSELIGERFTEMPAAFFSSKVTERGHEDESVAIKLFEMQKQVEVEPVTIILNHGAGYSPDGLVGGAGLIEVKSKAPKFQVDILESQEVPNEHMGQLQGGLWVAEREWIDFISYCRNMPLFIKRVHRDEKMITKISDRVKIFQDLMQERINNLIKIG